MPEGDTIFRVARALHRALAGKIVTGFETALAPLARANDDTPLVGRTIERVESRGKWCLIHLSGDLILLTHMRMSGSWHLYRTGERWQLGRSHMRLVLRASDGATTWEAVAFNVPVAELHTARSLARNTQIPHLGPDILSSDLTIDTGAQRLADYGRSHPDAEIAVVLLNQHVIAGLGNVYKSEVAFAAGVHPFRTMRSLTPDEREKLVTIAQRYMQSNVLDTASAAIVTYTGNRRTTHSSNREERLWVYRRQGQECRRCGAIIEMRKQGEQARSTYWCPQCQPIKAITESIAKS
jgi:endonuclease-8